MNLDQLESGWQVVADANILVYHLAGLSEQCRRFVLRCHAGELQGFMPVHTRLETLHRVMTLEAVRQGLVSGGNPARKLAEHPDRIARLSSRVGDVQALLARFRWLDLTVQAFERVPLLCLSRGLLANDAALVATMLEHGLTRLASADRKLERVPEVAVWKPDDLVA